MMTDEQPDDTDAVTALFARAGILVRRVTDTGGGRVLVEVGTQKNVLGRVKKLYESMTDDARYSILYGANVAGNGEAYWLSRLEG